MKHLITYRYYEYRLQWQIDIEQECEQQVANELIRLENRPKDPIEATSKSNRKHGNRLELHKVSVNSLWISKYFAAKVTRTYEKNTKRFGKLRKAFLKVIDTKWQFEKVPSKVTSCPLCRFRKVAHGKELHYTKSKQRNCTPWVHRNECCIRVVTHMIGSVTMKACGWLVPSLTWTAQRNIHSWKQWRRRPRQRAAHMQKDAALFEANLSE